jgi:hypothetical protein
VKVATVLVIVVIAKEGPVSRIMEPNVEGVKAQGYARHALDRGSPEGEEVKNGGNNSRHASHVIK